MLVRDLEYMEVASSKEVEGGFATAFTNAFSFANGPNVAQTADNTNSSANTFLVTFFPPFSPPVVIGSNSASGSSSSSSQSS